MKSTSARRRGVTVTTIGRSWSNGGIKVDIGGILAGRAPAAETRTFFLRCMAVAFGVSLIADQTSMRFGFDSTVLIIVLLGLGASLFSLFAKSPYLVHGDKLATGASAVYGLLWVMDALDIGLNMIWSYDSGRLVSAVIGLTLVGSAAGFTRLARHSWFGSNPMSVRASTGGAPVAASPALNPLALRFAMAGAAGVLLSLLVLPWMRIYFEGENMTASFNDLRDIYNLAKDSGFTDARFYFLDWGYLAAYASAGLGLFLSYDARSKGHSSQPVLARLAIPVATLMGVWQAVLAGGLTSLDEGVEVQLGAWLGVVGLALLVVSFVMFGRAGTGAARPVTSRMYGQQPPSQLG